MKYIITESQYNKAIDKFITYELEPHDVKTTETHPGSIFWVKNGIVVAEIKKSGYFYLKSKIWKKIGRMFSTEGHGIESLIKHWLEEHYKLRGLTVFCESPHQYMCWKNIIN